MRTRMASAAIVLSMSAVPQIALAQANFGYNAAPYCLQNPEWIGKLLLPDDE